MIDRLARTWWGAILSDCDTEPTELGMGVLGVVWGIWLLLPFATFKSSAAYDALAYFTEPYLGGAALAIGLYILVALRIGRPSLRRAAALISFAFWFAVSALFLEADATNTGGIVYGIAACSQAWVHSALRSRVAI